MKAAAELLAAEVEARIGPAEGFFEPDIEAQTVHAMGDLVEMLRLPAWSSHYEPMSFEIERVLRLDGSPWQPDPQAEVLLLGDSFTAVFTDERLGLGTSAGLAPQLARAAGRTVDVIAIPNGSATQVRAALARREDPFAHTRLVVWQFSMRTLADPTESWKLVELPEPTSTAGPSTEPTTGPSLDPQPTADTRLEILAEIVEVTEVPTDFDYPECLGIYRYRALSGDGPVEDEADVWVAHLVMKGRKRTEAADYQVGDLYELTLEPLDAHYDLEQVASVGGNGATGTIWFAVEE